MVKRIIYFVIQGFAFFGLMFVGGLSDSINLSFEYSQMKRGNFHSHGLIPTIKIPLGSHNLIANGVIYATCLLLIILLVGTMRKRLKPLGASLSVLAFVLAVTLGFAMKLGLPPAN